MLFHQPSWKNLILKRWGLNPFEYTHTGPLDLLVLQPTPYCNLACSYCYLTTKDDRSKMSFETLKKTLERVFSSGLVKDEFTIVWHAGEPTVPGLNYYREAYRIIEEMTPSGIKVNTNFQTNATLISDEWCDFIKEKKISIGVSVDGPEQFTDLNRKTRTGRGAFSQTKRGMDLLRSKGVYFYTISVLTEASLDYPEKFYEFFVENEIREACFNLEEKEVAHQNSSLTIEKDRKRFYNFLSRFDDLVAQGDFKIEVRELRGANQAIVNWKGFTRNFNGYAQENWPFQIINVAYDGNFSTYSPEMVGVHTKDWGAFIFGNVHKNTFKDALQDPRFIEVTKSIRKGIQMCKKSCSYYDLCGGGSPANKYYENGTFASTTTTFCSLHKQVPMDVMLDKIEGKLKLSQKSLSS